MRKRNCCNCVEQPFRMSSPFRGREADRSTELADLDVLGQAKSLFYTYAMVGTQPLEKTAEYTLFWGMLKLGAYIFV